MDETGTIINEAVGIGDELTAIDSVLVRSMPVGDVVKRVSGQAGLSNCVAGVAPWCLIMPA